MGIISDAIKGVAALAVRDAVYIPGMPPSAPIIDLKTGEKTYPADVSRAYYSNAFRACLLAKARPLASLPVDVYTRDHGVRGKATSRAAKALSRLLRTKWNPLMTGSEGIRWAVMTKDTMGNAFVRVEWSGGVPVALWPMTGIPTRTFKAGRLVYEYPGDKRTPEGRYFEHEVVWLKSPVLDEYGEEGVSLAQLGAGELGLSIDLEDFYQKLITNGNHFPLWLETDASLNSKDVEALQKQLADHRGLVNAGETRIFDKGLHVNQTKLTMADMSLVEQERWILQQTCRTTSVPPQEVFDLSNATYSNIEQGANNFAQKTLMPECFMFEKSFSSVLWAIGHVDEFVQIDMNGLLRGAYRERMEGYRTGIMSGVLNREETRKWEDLPPYEGSQYFMVPTAYSLVDPDSGEMVNEQPKQQQAAQPTPDVGGSGEGVQQTTGEPNGRPPENALQPVYRDMETRVRDRFAERGDTPQARAFASRVLTPYSDACLMARIPYDMDADIDRIAKEAING